MSGRRAVSPARARGSGNTRCGVPGCCPVCKPSPPGRVWLGVPAVGPQAPDLRDPLQPRRPRTRRGAFSRPLQTEMFSRPLADFSTAPFFSAYTPLAWFPLASCPHFLVLICVVFPSVCLLFLVEQGLHLPTGPALQIHTPCWELSLSGTQLSSLISKSC